MNLTEKDVAKPFCLVLFRLGMRLLHATLLLCAKLNLLKKVLNSSGGTPREFCTITVTDGIAWGHERMNLP